MLARSLAREPRLLVIDDPALLPNLGDRDRFFALLRTAARERKITMLMASEEMAALQGVGVMISIADGELVSSEPRAAPSCRFPGAGARGRSVPGSEHARAARRRQALLDRH